VRSRPLHGRSAPHTLVIMRRRPAALAAACGLLFMLTGCMSFADTVTAQESAAASSSAAVAEVPPVNWRDCNEQIRPLIAGQPGADRDLSFECGRTDVPISYEEPQGATLPLFLVRVKLAGQTDRIGSLVVNPGGPGGSGSDAAIGLSLTLPEDVLRRFDLVGFDPRGVGLSTPVECIPAPLKDQLVASEPRPVTDQQLDAAFALADEVGKDCTKKYGDALGTFNTVDTARDMDRLRQALGDAQLTYLGYSYGTTLGSTYAELFPDNVRALVLDGAVDPDKDPVADAEASAKGFETGFDAFAENCKGLVAGCPIGDNPREFVYDLLDRAEQNPIPSKKAGETRTATAGVVLSGVQAGLYDQQSWPQLAQALAAAAKGDSAGLFSLSDNYSGRLQDGTYSNLFDANLAINCADTPTDQQVSSAEVRRLAGEWNQKYPLFGAGSAVSLYTCSTWDAKRTPLPHRDAAGAAPILVVGNAGDPVTPLPGAVDMAHDLASGILLTWQGQGHTSYPKTPCVTDAVDKYLIDRTAPQDGLTCPAG
jgi:pimeloyl-ACP methyl ester carboxylesterase